MNNKEWKKLIHCTMVVKFEPPMWESFKEKCDSNSYHYWWFWDTDGNVSYVKPIHYKFKDGQEMPTMILLDLPTGKSYYYYTEEGYTACMKKARAYFKYQWDGKL